MKIRLPLYSDFMETVLLDNGLVLPMSIQRVMDGDDPDLDFRTPRLVGKVRRNSAVSAGTIITYLDEKYLTTTRAVTPDYRTFWLFKCDRQVAWQRPTPVVDTLTGLTKSTAMTSLGDIWVSWEMMARQPIDRQLGISNEVNRVLVGAEVQLNDLIDGQQVKRMNHSMGVRILEVQ